MYRENKIPKAVILTLQLMESRNQKSHITGIPYALAHQTYNNITMNTEYLNTAF